MAQTTLNDATVKMLPIPAKGNRVHYFPGAALRGQIAPRGFGIRVTAGTLGALVKVLLLTGQRRAEVGGMRRSEIGPEGVWTIPAMRYKTKRAHAVPLSAPALAVIEAQPKGDVVFASGIGTAFSAYTNSKAQLDQATGVTGWTLHDLRRTAKTLMQRARVRPDISERVLGHVQGAIEATYDRYSYIDEKREALGKLAAMVERIREPPENVIALRG